MLEASRSQSALQRQIVQMALELAADLEQQAQQASPGNVVAACEALLLDQGRQFLRDALACTLQSRIDQEEKKGGPPAPVPVDTLAVTRGPVPANS
jgi:hypothetical protein